MPCWESFLVLWVSVDPVDIRNNSQQGTRSQAVCSSNFSDVSLGSNFVPFFKKVTFKESKSTKTLVDKLSQTDDQSERVAQPDTGDFFEE